MNRVIKFIKMSYSDLSIIKKININIILIVIFPIFILTLINNQVSSSIIVKNTLDSSRQSINLFSQNLLNLTAYGGSISKIIAANKVLQDSILSFSKLDNYEKYSSRNMVVSTIDKIIQTGQVIRSVVIYCNNGQLFCSGAVDINKISQSDIVKNTEILNNSTAVFPKWLGTHKTNYYSSAAKSDLQVDCISLLQPIFESTSGRVLGLIELNISLNSISEIFPRVNSDSQAKYLLVSKNGQILYSGISSEIYNSIGNEPYFIKACNYDNMGEIINIRNNKYVVTTKKIKALDWMIIGIIPVKELTADNNKVTNAILVAFLICIIFSIISSFFVSKSILNPIITLEKTMAAAGQGDLECRIKVLHNDEIGRLSTNFNKMIDQISHLMDQIYKDQKKERKLELRILQSQINPHFLCNTLESVCSLSQLNRPGDVFNLSKSLAMFYRTVLSKGDNLVSIKEEIENIEYYLNIQKIRYYDILEYEINVDNEVLDLKIIKLIIQPIVENALYHGIKEKCGKGKITVKGSTDGRVVKLTVIDDGVGMSEQKLKLLLSDGNIVNGRQSYGVKNVDERIKLFFGQEFGISIQSTQGIGTQVELTIPFNNINVEGDEQ